MCERFYFLPNNQKEVTSPGAHNNVNCQSCSTSLFCLIIWSLLKIFKTTISRVVLTVARPELFKIFAQTKAITKLIQFLKRLSYRLISFLFWYFLFFFRTCYETLTAKFSRHLMKTNSLSTFFCKLNIEQHLERCFSSKMSFIRAKNEFLLDKTTIDCS